MDRAKLKSWLIREEDEVLHAYTDSEGYLTIGVGRLIDLRKGGGISHEEADLLLTNDISEKYAELTTRFPWTTQLDDVRFNALMQMAFQMGVDGLAKFKLAMAYMQGGSYTQAAGEFLNSLWAKQTPNRAKRVTDAIRTGQYPDGT